MREEESQARIRELLISEKGRMLTREMLDIYERFHGNAEAWARAVPPGHLTTTDQDWRVIDELVQGWRSYIRVSPAPISALRCKPVLPLPPKTSTSATG